MRKGKKFVAMLAVVVCICTAPLLATPDPTYISGTSTATLITDGGVYDGWYLYEIDMDWDLNTLGAGLSHWDLILKPDFASWDYMIGFDTPAGYSTTVEEPTDPDAMGWTVYFQRDGDDSIVPEILDPVVKYNDPFYPPGQPGPEGYGTFRFYANTAPEYGTYADALMAKGGTIDPVYGDLTGAYPIPEPATVLLLGLGGLALLRKRRN